MAANPFYRKRRRITREEGRYILRDEESGQVFVLADEWEVVSLALDAVELLHAKEVTRDRTPK